jgi:hypothetical protein
MNDYVCAEQCAAAARNDIRRTLVRYFQFVGDTERAEERAAALLDHYDQTTATQIRASAFGDDSPGNEWNWWDAATIPDSIADLIAPKPAFDGVATEKLAAVGEDSSICCLPTRSSGKPPIVVALEFDMSPEAMERFKDAVRSINPEDLR